MTFVAVITGGANGIGKAFAEAILKRGGKVCIADLDIQGQNTVDEFRKQFGDEKAIFVKCDVANPTELRNVFEEAKKTFSRIDVVSNNAGIVHETQWRKCIGVNLAAVVEGSYLAREFMGKDKGGHGGVIINTASLAGLVSFPNGPVYAATKSGVIGFTRSYAEHEDYPKHGVRINALCPSFVDTNIINVKEGQVFGKLDIGKYSPNGDLLSTSKVAEGFMQLVDDESQNGSILTITIEHGFVYKEYE